MFGWPVASYRESYREGVKQKSPGNGCYRDASILVAMAYRDPFQSHREINTFACKWPIKSHREMAVTGKNTPDEAIPSKFKQTYCNNQDAKSPGNGSYRENQISPGFNGHLEVTGKSCSPGKEESHRETGVT